MYSIHSLSFSCVDAAKNPMLPFVIDLIHISITVAVELHQINEKANTHFVVKQSLVHHIREGNKNY